MGKMKVLQSSLNGGELSPRLKGRPELPRYQSGLEICDNFVPLVLGGAVTRPGTRMVNPALVSPDMGNRLDCYTSADDNGVYRGFCIESAPYQIRAFCGYDLGRIGVQAYAEGTEFAPKQVSQYKEYLYLMQPDTLPLRVKRNSDTDWTIEPVPFQSIPLVRPPRSEGITLAPSAISGSCTVTASADFFQPGHVGVKFKLNGGVVKITSVVDATTAEADIVADFTLVGATAKAKTFIVSYEPQEIGGQTPTYAPTNPYTFQLVAYADFSGNQLRATVPTAYELAQHRFSVTTVDNEAALTGTEADQDWLEEAWSDLRGWPRSVTFFEQRMLLAGSTTYPTTVWGSKSGEILDFVLGTDDDDAFAYTLACADTPIRSIKASDRVYVFTATNEISIEGGNDKPLTPTNFRIKERSKQGASTMPPVNMSNDLIFASLSNYRLFNLVYRFDTDRFVTNDVSIFGEHLISEGGGIAQVAFTREPIPMLWCRTAAGGLITLTYDTEQQVAAWARITTAGIVQQIVSVPNETGADQIWAVIGRGGSNYIEAFEWGLNTDCCVTGSDPEGKAEWFIAAHLEGKQVAVVADGYVVQGLTVADGKVTLPFPAKEVEIGLPFTARLKDLPPAVAGVSSTIVGQVSINQVQVLLHNTKGATVNGERIPFQKFGGELLDKPVPSFTGWKKVGGLGWGDSGSGGQVEIVRDQPLPCTVLAIAKSVTVND